MQVTVAHATIPASCKGAPKGETLVAYARRGWTNYLIPVQSLRTFAVTDDQAKAAKPAAETDPLKLVSTIAGRMAVLKSRNEARAYALLEKVMAKLMEDALKELEQMTLKELTDFYNTLQKARGKDVIKQFSDKKTGIARIRAVQVEMGTETGGEATTPGGTSAAPVAGTPVDASKIKPIPPKGPKARVARIMERGTSTFPQIAEQVGTTESNVRAHAKQLKDRGFDYTVAEDGKVTLVIPAGVELFSAAE